VAMKEGPEDEQPNTRSANGESTIYYGADGYWHGRVTMGVRDDGRADRRHIMRKAGPEGEEDLKTRDKVAKLVRELEKQRDQGTAKRSQVDR